MFYVIERSYNAAGVVIESESIAEFDTWDEASAMVDRMYANHAEPDDNGNWCEWFVVSD